MQSANPSFVAADEGPRVEALGRGYASGALSPVEETRAALARAEAINPTLKAFTFLDPAGAIAAAEASERRWRAGAPLSPIDGVPTTIKELVRVAGWSVRYGSTTSDATPYTEDAPAVARLRAAGAVLIGLTTSPEFGWKAVTDSRMNGVTRNPWDPATTSGGSSGGAAVAAACNAGVLHLGTDGGGSIRVPAAFCGIAGLKPTFGRIAAYPASSFGTVAHLGPMTRRIEDSAHMMAIMAGRDLADWAQGAGALPPIDPDLGAAKISGSRIGVWSTPPCSTVDPEIAAAFAATLTRIEAMGGRLEPVDLPYADRLTDIFEKHWYSGAAIRLAGVPDHLHGDIDPGFLEIAAAGAGFGAVDVVAAEVARAGFGAEMDRLLATYDFIVSPATAVLPFGAGLEVPEGSGLARWIHWAGFSFPINLSQQPAAVVPVALSAGGLPIAVQIIGRRGDDHGVLAAGRDLQVSLAAPASRGVAR